ncbi:MAG: ester cyclase [Pseudomonadales bacterium]
MTAFENAQKFFHACESLHGWSGCKDLVAPGATFVAQSEPIADIVTVEGYCEWMKSFGTEVVPGCGYEIHAQSFDADTRVATFFATFTGTHTGAGGPQPPTGQSVSAHYVYALDMDANDRVAHMVKIWNAPWSMRQLGWIN